MNNKIDRLEEKVDKIVDSVHNIDKHLAIYNEELKRHIEGVELARQENRESKKAMNEFKEDVNERLDPIDNHVKFVQITFKYFLLPIIVGFITYFLKSFWD